MRERAATRAASVGAQLDRGTYSGVSSIGPTDGIYIVGNRIKGFVDRIIRTSDDFDYLLETLDHFAARIDVDPGLSRMSVRAVVNMDSVEGNPSLRQKLAGRVEAVVPLGNGQQENLAVVYFGYNNGTRRASQSDMERYSANLLKARGDSRSHVNASALAKEMSGALQGGNHEYAYTAPGGRSYSVRFLDQSHASQAERGSLVGLMGAFGYGQGDVDSILGNPNNRIAVATRDGRIVCVAVAESASVALSGDRPLNIVEMTDAVVDKEERGNNVYFIASMFLMISIINRQRVDLVYGESNLESPGVLSAANHQGRRFSTDTAEGGGLGRGILDYHTIIDNRICSLVVTFLNAEMLSAMRSMQMVRGERIDNGNAA